MDLSIFGDIFSSLTKIGLLFFLLLYIVFSFIVSKQVNLMTKTLQVGLDNILRSIALLHLIVSVLVFVYAFFVL